MPGTTLADTAAALSHSSRPYIKDRKINAVGGRSVKLQVDNSVRYALASDSAVRAVLETFYHLMALILQVTHLLGWLRHCVMRLSTSGKISIDLVGEFHITGSKQALTAITDPAGCRVH